MNQIVTERNCERCHRKTRVRLSRNITASGTSQAYWYCLSGNHPITKNGYFIPHEKIRAQGFDPDDLPVVENYSGMNLCAVCQSPCAEYHHFAPKHLFGNEAEEWPKAYLCPKHHKKWHDIVTPGMSG